MLAARKLKRCAGMLAALPRCLASPAQRYRHARLLHSVRVTLAVLASIALTTGIDIPHGLWATVSLLVVIGGLQHHGNIRKKAADRALGTIIGALLGLAVITQYAFIGSSTLTYLLLAAVAGACSYHAIGKGGYIALLAAITVFIVAGHGDESLQTALWRTADVVIGISIALAFSFVLPFYATYSWRHSLAANMRGVARICGQVLAGAVPGPQEQLRRYAELGKRLIELRTLMPSVAKETGIPLASLEAVQSRHRAILSGLEMLLASAHGLMQCGRLPALIPCVRGDIGQLRRTALLTARALRSGDIGRLPGASGAGQASGPAYMGEVAADLEGPHWLCRQLARQVEGLDQALENSRALFKV